MDGAQWSQQVASYTKPMEEITSGTTTPPPHNNNNNNNSTISRGGATTQQQQQQQQETSLERRTTRPQKDQNVNCPRCNSTNTKFCYYNNYSLTQPRFFCKTCRRYWTQGGSLRNVPVGGGSRKNKRSSYSSAISNPPPLHQPPQLSPSTTAASLPPNHHNKLLIPDLNPPTTSLSHLIASSQNPNFKFLEGHDLNLAFPMQGLFHHQLPKMDGNNTKNENYESSINMNNGNISTNNNSGSATTATTTTTTTATSGPLSALELLRSGIASRGSMDSFVPMTMSDPNTLYHQSGYPNMQEFKPTSMMMNIFSTPSHNNHDENNNNNNNNNNMVVGLNDDDHENNTNARLLFPFADMNKLATNTQQHHHDQTKGHSENDHHHSGYWSGMLGGGTW